MFLEMIVERLWRFLFLPLFFLCAASILLRSGFLPLRKIGLALQLPFQPQYTGENKLRPGQAAAASLAATVGTGNIIGTAQALAMGGPGAVFWMWAAALLGIPVKYAEIYWGLKDRKGAMGYISKALSPCWAVLYASCAAASTILMGNMAQMNGAVTALHHLCGAAGASGKVLLALILTGLAAWSMAGGAKSVGRVTQVLVPLMGFAYVGVILLLLTVRRSALLAALEGILRSAFTFRAPLAAAGGISVRQAIIWGLRRGTFSNEAGLGTAANIHACAEAGEISKHALWGVFEVLVDGLLCTLTALAILTSDVPIPHGTLPGAELLQRALSLVFGERTAGFFLAGELCLFGMSTVIGCAVSGGVCARWLGGSTWEKRYRAVYLAAAFLGGMMPLPLLWQAADAVNVALAIPNLLALFLLAPALGRELKNSKDSGEERIRA